MQYIIKNIKKILAIFLLVVLLVCFMTVVFFPSNNTVSARASVIEDYQQQERLDNLKQSSERMIAATREEYKDLKEYP